MEEKLNTNQENNAESAAVESDKNLTPNKGFIPRGPDRRRNMERRDDPREEGGLSLGAWIKALFRPRVGVDRRKGSDRRRDKDQPSASAELTPEELKNLLD